MHPGVAADKLQDVIQRMDICLRAVLQGEGELVAAAEQLADVGLAHGGGNVGQFMVDRLHQTTDCLVDAAVHFLAGGTQHITVYIDGSILQCLGQVELGVVVAFPHLHPLCFLDGLVLCKLYRGVFAQEALDLQVGAHFGQEGVIVGQCHKHFLALPGDHPQGRVLHAALIPRGQHTQPDIVALICLVGAVIHHLVEREGVPSAECRILVLFAGEDVLKDHLSDLREDFRHLHVFFFNLVVDLLLLIGQEHIDAAVFLDQHLAHQHLQGFLRLCFQGKAVIVDVGDHQAGDVVHICLDLHHIFDQEQGLQHVDGKDVLFLLFRVDVAVIIGTNDHAAVAVVKEVFQCIVEFMERHDGTDFFVHQLHGRLFEQCQHRALTLGQMLTGCTVGTDAGQHTCQKVELIGHKGVHLCKILRIGIQLFLHTVVENNEVLDDGALLVVDQPQALGCGVGLFQNTFFDNGIHVCGRQRQTGIKAPLNLGEIVALHLSDGVDILLRGHNDPRLALTFLAQFLGHSLEVQHQLGVIADILTDLIHQKDNMVVAAFLIQISLHTLGKVLDADLVGLHCLFAPVAGGGLAHAHIHQNLHNGVLNKIKVLPGILPRIAVGILKLFLERSKLVCLSKVAFQIRKVGHGAAEPLHFVEHLQEHVHYGILVLLAVGFAFGVDIEQDHIRRRVCCQLHICQNHLVCDFFIVDEEIPCVLIAHLLVFQQIGQDLQKVRFTASKETGDPYAHFRRGAQNTFFISRKKIRKVPLQFTGYHILFQFLCNIGLCALTDYDNTLKFTVDLLTEHLLDLHSYCILPLFHQPECPVIVIVLNLVEQDQFLFVVGARKEHYDRAADKCLMQVVQNLMGPQNRIALSDTRQKHDGVLRRMFLDILHDEAVVVIDLHGVGNRFGDPFHPVFLFKVIALFQKALLLQKINDDIIEIEHHQLKVIITTGIFAFHILDSSTNFQLFFRWIVENPVVHLVGSAGSLAEGRFPDCRFHLIQPVAQASIHSFHLILPP